MKRYFVEITRTSSHVYDAKKKRFLTAAGMLRYARKIAEHYPKDTRVRYAFCVASGGRETALFTL